VEEVGFSAKCACWEDGPGILVVIVIVIVIVVCERNAEWWCCSDRVLVLGPWYEDYRCYLL
jgi:hypothetical protein